MKTHATGPLAFVLLLVSAVGACGQDVALAAFEKRITVKRLANGLTVLIMERPEAPVFSSYIHVNVGSAQEGPGTTGLAHMFEHMAFKGTDKIGTTNYPAEKAALAKVEQAYAAYQKEDRRETGRDPRKVAALRASWEKAMHAADKYVIPDQFGRIVESEGGQGMNAETDWDETVYYYSLPENRFELWAYLESERFLHPVMRQFYKERDVVMEERRMRTDSSPQGRLLEQFLAAAFIAHPYGRPVVGWPSDLQSFSATDAMNFFHKYYVPSNIVVAVVGDVQAAKALPIIEKYFGRLPSVPAPAPLRTQEPPQLGQREVVLQDGSQPMYIEGYHRPGFHDPDDAVYDVLADLLSKGPTSRLYRSLVRDQQIAVSVEGGTLPGTKYPSLFYFFAAPTRGHTAEEMADPIHEEIEKLKSEDVGEDELQSVKTRAKADLIRQLNDNQGLATQLGDYQADYGDWQELFYEIDRIEAVSQADIRRIANHIFVPKNRTIGRIETAAPPSVGQSVKGEEQ
jgi:predicted Zn-dependent peptidase